MIRKTYLCPRCGKPMTLIDVNTEDEDVILYVFRCNECGMEFYAFVSEEKPEQQTIDDQGFGKCPFCGGYLAWEADFTCSEISGLEPDENDSVAQELQCYKCGAQLTAYYPPE